MKREYRGKSRQSLHAFSFICNFQFEIVQEKRRLSSLTPMHYSISDFLSDFIRDRFYCRSSCHRIGSYESIRDDFCQLSLARRKELSLSFVFSFSFLFFPFSSRLQPTVRETARLRSAFQANGECAARGGRDER
jgi:hypothetical protein